MNDKDRTFRENVCFVCLLVIAICALLMALGGDSGAQEIYRVNQGGTTYLTPSYPFDPTTSAKIRGGSVSVSDFLACGNNICDDTLAIQNAINSVCLPISGQCTLLGGTVVFPAGIFKTTAPILLYGGVTLQGAGKLASKISKANNAIGTFGSITAGTTVGRSPTACSGGPCVDNFNVDAIIEVIYISSGATDYAYRWAIRDLGLFGSGVNGTKYGIFAPRAAQSEMKNLYLYMACSQGAPANCGGEQGNAFFTEDAWLMRHEGVTVDSSWIGWNHVNDGSNAGTGTSGVFTNDWGVNIGCSGFHFFGLSYSTMSANAIDNFDKKGTDLAASDITCAPYSFNTVNGLSINGGGAENVTGGVMYAAASSVTVSGGFKTFSQTGYTSAGTLASLFIDSGAMVTMSGTLFSAVTSPGNILNIVLQGGSTLVDTNSTLPSGGSTFIGYGGGASKIDVANAGITLTNANGTQPFTRTIGSGTVTTAGTAIAAGTCQAQTGITITGATTTDVGNCSLNAAAPATWQTGIQLADPEITANTVTVRLCNGTAASITPAAATVRCMVTR